MHSTTIFSVLAATLSAVSAQTTTYPITGTLGNATVVENNPPGVIYTANLPPTSFVNPADPRGNVKGSVSGTANPNGIGVAFQVSFSNLPTSGGPFLYHIHTAPVPADGNCTLTEGHLDPFNRSETPACDETLPQTCQVGDLSGKHGTITSDPFTVMYTDDFPSTLQSSESYFGNLSFVVHFANKTRITCANFALVGSLVGGSGNATGTSANATTSTTGTAPAKFTGAAGMTTVPVLSLLGVVAVALML